MATWKLKAATKCKETIIKDCSNVAIDIMKLDVSLLDT
nr:hypothetical protein [Tanacetum cinerariifolium]